MGSNQKPGRNSPCPCGSGKKYKHCCGDFYQTGVMFYNAEKSCASVPEYLIALHKAAAYLGKAGSQRLDFCKQYIVRKQTGFKQMAADLMRKTVEQKESITCREGCSYCCSQYISGTLHEAEAIVNYLYRNETVLDRFLENYATWRSRVNNIEGVFRQLETYFGKLVSEGENEENRSAFEEAGKRYRAENISCPFLNESSCSIYQVRPWCCASIISTTPGEYCFPANNRKPRIYVSSLRPKEVPFFRHTRDLVIVNIPVSVHELLAGGYGWLSGIPGLEGLGNETRSQVDVEASSKRRGD